MAVVLLYIIISDKVYERTDLLMHGLEIICSEVHHGNTTLLIGTLYRPPYTTWIYFLA